VQLYWLHTNGQEEIWLSDLKPNEAVGRYAEPNHIFRFKWVDNRGLFGQDILEEYKIVDGLGMDQDFEVCRPNYNRMPGRDL
jgi:hypothetical protein